MMLPNSQPIKVEQLKIFPFDGKPVELATSKDVVIGCDPGSESGDWSPFDPNLQMEFTIKGTHKNQRQARKLRKALNLHKPRVPRKKKKEIKKWLIERIRFYEQLKNRPLL